MIWLVAFVLYITSTSQQYLLIYKLQALLYIFCYCICSLHSLTFIWY